MDVIRSNGHVSGRRSSRRHIPIGPDGDGLGGTMLLVEKRCSVDGLPLGPDELLIHGSACAGTGIGWLSRRV